MKKFLIALNLVIWSFVGYQVTSFAAEPVKKEIPKEVTNCVKKDKNGKCPPPPKSPKPTPKKVEPK